MGSLSMSKKEWLNEQIMCDEWGRPPSLADVPLTVMARKDALKKQGKDIEEEWFMFILKGCTEALGSLEGELDDAFYSIPEYDCNSDARSSVDSARNTLYHIKDTLEKLVK